MGTMTHHRVISIICLAVAGLGSANAQTFVFSSCASRVTFRATISDLKILPGNPIPDGNGGRQYNYTFTGGFTLTQNGSTQSSTGFSTLAVGFVNNPASLGGARTTLLIEAPDATGTGGPGMGAAASRREWGIGLQAMGDLLPNGFTGDPAATFRVECEDSRLYFSDQRLDRYVRRMPHGQRFGNQQDPGGSLDLSGVRDMQPSDQRRNRQSVRAGGRLSDLRPEHARASPATTTASAARPLFATTLGTNWRSNYDRYLRIVSASSVIAERPDGQQVNFTLTSGAWTTDTDVDLKLTNSGTTWTLTDTHDTVETYTASRRDRSAAANDPRAQRLHADAAIRFGQSAYDRQRFVPPAVELHLQRRQAADGHDSGRPDPHLRLHRRAAHFSRLLDYPLPPARLTFTRTPRCPPR